MAFIYSIRQTRHILYADYFVSKYKAEDEHRIQRGIALIAATTFAVMSLSNPGLITPPVRTMETAVPF